MEQILSGGIYKEQDGYWKKMYFPFCFETKGEQQVLLIWTSQQLSRGLPQHPSLGSQTGGTQFEQAACKLGGKQTQSVVTGSMKPSWLPPAMLLRADTA